MKGVARSEPHETFVSPGFSHLEDPLKSVSRPGFSAIPSTFATKEEALAYLARGLPVRCHVSGELLEGGECLGFFDAASDEEWEQLQEALLETPRRT
jgi:hypothetical protein